MKNILTILMEAGLEVTNEQKEVIDKAVLENYRTNVDYEKATKKRDEYKQSLEKLQGKLEAFKDVNVDDLQEQITTLTNDLQAEKDARAADAKKAELEKGVEKFLSGKTFVNDITMESIRTQLMEALDKDSAKGKSIDDIFAGLITDKEGKQLENILIDEQQRQAEQARARFTAKKMNSGGGALTKSDFQSMSVDERTELKASNPELYESLKK